MRYTNPRLYFTFLNPTIPYRITLTFNLLKHILVECVDLNALRNKHFVAYSIKYVLDNVEAQKIIDFIKETRFYKQLKCFHINVC